MIQARWMYQSALCYYSGIPAAVNSKRPKVYSAPSFGGWSPRVGGSIALGLWAAHHCRETWQNKLCTAQARMQRKSIRPGSRTPVWGHVPSDLRTPCKAPLLKVHRTSQDCHLRAVDLWGTLLTFRTQMRSLNSGVGRRKSTWDLDSLFLTL